MNSDKTGTSFKTGADGCFHGCWDIKKFTVDKNRSHLRNFMYQSFPTLIDKARADFESADQRTQFGNQLQGFFFVVEIKANTQGVS